MNKRDEQRFGMSIFLGFACGGILGLALGAANGNMFNGFWMGGLIGAGVGWFAAAAVIEKEKTNKQGK